MSDKEAVVFAIPNPPAAEEQNPMAPLATLLRKEFEKAELGPGILTLSSLGHAYFSVPVSDGKISISLWREQNPSNWQIWMLYRQPKASLHTALPNDLGEKLERAEQAIRTFLSATEAQEIRWISLEEANERVAP